MPKITNITEQASNNERLSIYIDGVFCMGIRKRTFQAMGLGVGSEISCSELNEKEKFFWKGAYQKEGAWKKEKVRIDKVSEFIKSAFNGVEVRIVGFGADSEELIKEHPDEMGKPDIDVLRKGSETLLLKVEVTGTERVRNGEGYWVRPDKLTYAENHPDEDVWIILHFSEPVEKFVFVKPVPGKKYTGRQINIRGAGENMCIFNDGDAEVKTRDEFMAHLNRKL